MAGASIEESIDPEGRPVVVPQALWTQKILRDHPELAPHLASVAHAISAPDLVLPDPIYSDRVRYYLRDAGPSRWLLVVVSYEQDPARVISAFGNRKDPPSWSR